MSVMSARVERMRMGHSGSVSPKSFVATCTRQPDRNLKGAEGSEGGRGGREKEREMDREERDETSEQKKKGKQKAVQKNSGM